MKNLHYNISTIKRKDREDLNGHNSFLIFFTGLSGAGKSTIANALEQKLFREKIHTYILDGDNIRTGVSIDLGFSREDRSENNRRVGEISKLFIEAGFVVLASLISPYESDRNFIKKTVGTDNYIEVYLSTSLEICEQRDVKGLYKKARSGEIKNMTGISAPYETPKNPDIKISHSITIEESVDLIYNKILKKLDLKCDFFSK